MASANCCSECFRRSLSPMTAASCPSRSAHDRDHLPGPQRRPTPWPATRSSPTRCGSQPGQSRLTHRPSRCGLGSPRWASPRIAQAGTRRIGSTGSPSESSSTAPTGSCRSPSTSKPGTGYLTAMTGRPTSRQLGQAAEHSRSPLDSACDQADPHDRLQLGLRRTRDRSGEEPEAATTPPAPSRSTS